MINIDFTEEEMKILDYERYHHPHPRVQRRMEALWLKSQNISHNQICRITGISPNTLTGYLRKYQEHGIEGLKEVNFYQPQSELRRYTTTIETYFREHPPASVKEAMAKIEELTGIKRSENRVREFLKSIGMAPRKVGMIPAKADIEEQERFITEELEPRLEEAKSGKRVVFFVDAAHFVLAPFLGILWSFKRLFIKAPAGRKRFNVLGALNATTHELITVTNDTYINAQSFCDLLWRISRLDDKVPITLILDNARYQKCKLVWELAESLGIELLYIPPYSPNLNLIERLWKFVKKECLYSKYYSEFKDFKNAIINCLNQTGTTYKEELDSLRLLCHIFKFFSFFCSQFSNKSKRFRYLP
ncbi:MAG: IS630 family transposase, partial [Candidatus Marinimicrobia bacterium]|nr:IS630 family transposase [Candidatus Neomarinimicrobiota bacterium]